MGHEPLKAPARLSPDTAYLRSLSTAAIRSALSSMAARISTEAFAFATFVTGSNRLIFVFALLPCTTWTGRGQATPCDGKPGALRGRTSCGRSWRFADQSSEQLLGKASPAQKGVARIHSQEQQSLETFAWLGSPCSTKSQVCLRCFYQALLHTAANTAKKPSSGLDK